MERAPNILGTEAKMLGSKALNIELECLKMV